MIEFHARLLVDSQDPELAYEELRQALQRSDIRIRIQDNWMLNNTPLPQHAAQTCALNWAASKDTLSVNPNVRFQTESVSVQQSIDFYQDQAGELS